MYMHNCHHYYYSPVKPLQIEQFSIAKYLDHKWLYDFGKVPSAQTEDRPLQSIATFTPTTLQTTPHKPKQIVNMSKLASPIEGPPKPSGEQPAAREPPKIEAYETRDSAPPLLHKKSSKKSRKHRKSTVNLREEPRQAGGGIAAAPVIAGTTTITPISYIRPDLSILDPPLTRLSTLGSRHKASGNVNIMLPSSSSEVVSLRSLESRARAVKGKTAAVAKANVGPKAAAKKSSSLRAKAKVAKAPTGGEADQPTTSKQATKKTATVKAVASVRARKTPTKVKPAAKSTTKGTRKRAAKKTLSAVADEPDTLGSKMSFDIPAGPAKPKKTKRTTKTKGSAAKLALPTKPGVSAKPRNEVKAKARPVAGPIKPTVATLATKPSLASGQQAANPLSRPGATKPPPASTSTTSAAAVPSATRLALSWNSPSKYIKPLPYPSAAAGKPSTAAPKALGPSIALPMPMKLLKKPPKAPVGKGKTAPKGKTGKTGTAKPKEGTAGAVENAAPLVTEAARLAAGKELKAKLERELKESLQTEVVGMVRGISSKSGTTPPEISLRLTMPRGPVATAAAVGKPKN